ncbi:MAG: phosphoribosyl-ATP diphosphatase [Planctomycetota bacterium]|nr:MAG: phosphoribosyl-ATP diphosphatase [Planctomycetota bacterium]
MIIPSIDLMYGNAVQLVGGQRLEIDAGDPRPIMERFRIVGEVAVIDLDAALGQGSNADTIAELCQMGPCRVGGGIRDEAAAVRWLDAGASKVILGTAARPDLLRNLPKDRVIAALDARDGRVVDHGWTRDTGATIFDRMAELRDLVSGFLVTTVEREGRLAGADIALAERLAQAAGDARVTLAGGVTTPDEVARLDRLGCDAQVGMAIYTGRMDLADAVSALSTSDRPDALIPTVITDERGIALGMAYSDAESIRLAINTRRGVYHSRTRGLWIKGETSGDTQELLKADWDCDRDCLRFTVRQHGRGNCHLGTRSCWGADAGLGSLERRIAAQSTGADPNSYTARLLNDPDLLNAKLREEIDELIAAESQTHAAEEAADVLYFLTVAMRRAGITLADAESVLDRRARKVSRRPGNAKPAYTQPTGDA